MSVEENKALVRRLFVARGKTDLDALDKMLAPNFVSHTKLLPGHKPDREGYKRTIAEYAATFSNRRFIVEEQVAEADKVVSRVTAHATHGRRAFLGVAPTGKEGIYKTIFIHRISGGRIAEEWSLGTVGPKMMGQRLEQEERERERIEQELLVARRIQHASLPKEVPQLEGWQIAPYYQPAREVGGDFYDFHLLSEDRLGLVVGDATGKGVPAALVMATTCGILQAVSQALDSSSSGEVLERVNETLLARIPSIMFVTCFYAVLDPRSANLRYANAGHDLPYLHRQKGYEVEETPLSGDQGVDLILPDLDGKRVVIQLKRWTGPVRNRAIQATFAGMAHYQADEGWIITTSTFTKSARELARSTSVRLIDRDELAAWLEGLREEGTPDQVEC